MDSNDRALLRSVAELDALASLDKLTRRHGPNAAAMLDSLAERGLVHSYVLVVTRYYAVTMAGAEALDAATAASKESATR